MAFTIEFKDGTRRTVELAVAYSSDQDGITRFFGEPDELYLLALDFGTEKPRPTPVLELPSQMIKSIVSTSDHESKDPAPS